MAWFGYKKENACWLQELRKFGDTTDNISSNPVNQESKRTKASIDEPDEFRNQQEPPISENPRTSNMETDSSSLERYPAKRKLMWDYPPNQREEKPNVCQGADAFIVGGFDKWKKVNYGNRCAFLKHISCLQHKNAIELSENLLNQATHIGNILEKQSVGTVRMNHLRLKATVDIVRWLTFQTCAFRGHDESKKSKNQGNFVELLKLLESYNDELASAILNASCHSKYTSGKIQKEILHILANFTQQERLRLRHGMELFPIEMKNNQNLSNTSNIVDLCTRLVEIDKCETYNVLDRLIRLVLTLPISTATTERGFSAMKICKTRLCNKMVDEFLADNLVVYIEKEIAEKFDSNSVIDEFKALKGRKADL
ncbi:hypothetical protein CTI12_AA015370 [Artemisia annua]|uniref:HAT C-terminal dimerisation domain-containing protein n=1 Tax=Artemisia annua TaxID=35608 RepID=A0A2U1QL02_ARTAN|nr:hypothetical protein CTI12_AA015370 [Artemisia annua]